MKYIIIIIIIILFINLILSIYTFNQFFKRAKREIPLIELDLSTTHYALYEDIIRKYNDLFLNREYEKIDIISSDNKRLYADYYNQNSLKTVIFVHGYKATPLNNFARIANYFYEKGYNILFINQRAHGKSEGKYITFGVKESDDLIKWVKTINFRYNPSDIILYGASMGAASIEIASSNLNYNNIKLLVLDSGYNNICEEIKYECRHFFHFVPYPIYYTMKLLAKIKGFSLNVNPEDKLKNNTIPALFIHGKNDKMVKYEMGVKNYEACSSKKDFISTQAGHVMSIYTDYSLIIDGIEKMLNEQ